MTNHVFLNDQDIVECRAVGDQTVQSIEAMGKEIEELLKQLKARNKPQYVLDDLSALGNVPPEARKAVAALGKTLSYDRLAMVGSNGLVRFGANLIIRASGRRSRLRFFTDRAPAVAWLFGKK